MATVVWRPPPRTLADVRDPDGDPSYPRHLLEGCENALILFAARWHGRQDAWHVADMGVQGTCVDLDGARLAEMQAVYPPDWRFLWEDALEMSLAADSYDVVSLDPFTNLMQDCANLMPLWCFAARRAVVLGTVASTWVNEPTGWQVTESRKRSEFSGGVYWTVLEPCG